MRPKKPAESIISLDVIVVIATLIPITSDAVPDLFLLALALVLTYQALFPATIPPILTLIGAAPLLPAVLAVIRVGSNSSAAKTTMIFFIKLSFLLNERGGYPIISADKSIDQLQGEMGLEIPESRFLASGRPGLARFNRGANGKRLAQVPWLPENAS